MVRVIVVEPAHTKEKASDIIEQVREHVEKVVKSNAIVSEVINTKGYNEDKQIFDDLISGWTRDRDDAIAYILKAINS